MADSRLRLRRLHRIAMWLCLFTALTAIAGGAALISWSGGAPWLPPLEVLQHTPFGTFMIPGLVLLIAVGLSNLGAALLALRGKQRAGAATLTAGVLLGGWIVIEMLLLRMTEWLQLLYFAVAVATLGVGWQLWRTERAEAGGAH